MFKNYIFNRPITPHLTIYFPQLSSLLSIWHRLAGLILSFSLFFSLFFLELEVSSELNFFRVIIADYSHWLFTFFYLIFCIFFVYHGLNGFRHIFWDLLLLLRRPWIQTSSILILTFLFIIILKISTTL